MQRPDAHPEHEDQEVEAEFAHEEEVGEKSPELRRESVSRWMYW